MFQTIFFFFSLTIATTGGYYTYNNFKTENIIESDRIQLQKTIEEFLENKEFYNNIKRKPLDIDTWKTPMNSYGFQNKLDFNMNISYEYDHTLRKFYLCIYKDNPNQTTHHAVSRLREGFPRINHNNEMQLSNKKGYGDSYFFVNDHCGALNNYYQENKQEPVENGDYETPVAMTIWLESIDRYVMERAEKIYEALLQAQKGLQDFAAENEEPPHEDLTYNEVFELLLPYTRMPERLDGLNWHYGRSSENNYYFCLSTKEDIDTIDKWLWGNAVIELRNNFDSKEFKVNTQGCHTNAQLPIHQLQDSEAIYSKLIIGI